MTTYERGFIEIVEGCYGNLSPRELTEKFMQMGIVDFQRLKIFAVREHVEKLVLSGMGKVNSMWETSEHFACTYEYVRKCVYYYTDVNIYR